MERKNELFLPVYKVVDSLQLKNAKTLYEELEIKNEFPFWINSYINQFNLKKDYDYFILKFFQPTYFLSDCAYELIYLSEHCKKFHNAINKSIWELQTSKLEENFIMLDDNIIELQKEEPSKPIFKTEIVRQIIQELPNQFNFKDIREKTDKKIGNSSISNVLTGLCSNGQLYRKGLRGSFKYVKKIKI